MTNPPGKPPLSRTSPTERLSIRAPRELWDRVRAEAERRGVSVAQVVREAVDAAID